MSWKIKNVFEVNHFKIIIFISLVLASFSALSVENAGLCVMSLYENGVLINIQEIQGSQADDSMVFGIVGMLGFIFSPIYFLKLARSWWIGIFTSLCLLQLLSLCMVTIPLDQIIHDSVKFCDNLWLLSFLIFQSIFIILNLMYINFFSYWK